MMNLRIPILFGVVTTMSFLLGSSSASHAQGWVKASPVVTYYNVTIPHPTNQSAYAYPSAGTNPGSSDGYAQAISWYDSDDSSATAVTNMRYDFSWAGAGPSSQLNVTVTGTHSGTSAAPFRAKASGGGGVSAFNTAITGSQSFAVGSIGDMFNSFLVEYDANANGDYGTGTASETTTKT